uniref:Uncharacterized protein n=1 Tax=Solanum lycopersicum TaxID=4081 RepID=K4C4V3_SOLLC
MLYHSQPSSHLLTLQAAALWCNQEGALLGRG